MILLKEIFYKKQLSIFKKHDIWETFIIHFGFFKKNAFPTNNYLEWLHNSTSISKQKAKLYNAGSYQ